MITPATTLPEAPWRYVAGTVRVESRVVLPPGKSGVGRDGFRCYLLYRKGVMSENGIPIADCGRRIDSPGPRWRTFLDKKAWSAACPRSKKVDLMTLPRDRLAARPDRLLGEPEKK